MAKKLQLSYKEIETRLRIFRDTPVPAGEVGYVLLQSFGTGAQAVQRMREGKGIVRVAGQPDVLLVKGQLGYRATTTLRLMADLEALKADATVAKAAPKIVAVCDGETIRAYDRRTCSTFEQKLARLFCDFEFFYPLAGVERIEYTEESPADIKAAEKLARLHDEIRAYNEFTTDSDLHDLNTFIARLLFCFFAEDTGIFEPNLFTDAVKRYTLADGSDLAQFLDDAFNIMDIDFRLRPADLPSRIRQFPFVSGGLFRQRIQIPRLSAKARQIIIDSGDLNWQDINPDIFGSMIQAVVNPDTRANQGMHYTSVPNIMKVINPLFLDELQAEYHAAEKEAEQLRQSLALGSMRQVDYNKKCEALRKRLNALLQRMSRMKFFDPACGSGNFLIITYKALRLLEMDILALQQRMTGQLEAAFVDGSVISIQQFYGIELLDFPHEVAMLSLWLAEHQMNRKFNTLFRVNINALPLRDINHIRCGNACRVDWNEVCPHTKDEEVYLFGNPPYLGTKWQSEDQKEDVDYVMLDNPLRRSLDYIGCWFVLGAKYVANSNSCYSFVSTNSICQGEQVAALWPYVAKFGAEIDFAYTSFKWTNNAKNTAQVTCVIIGLSAKHAAQKVLYSGEKKHMVKNINYYLLDAPNVVILHRATPLSDLPIMTKGSQPTDGGNLILDIAEKDELVTQFPQIEPYIKRYMGADDLINSKVRYCLWLKDCPSRFLEIPPVKNRLAKVATTRLESTKAATRKWAEKPHLFTETRQPSTDYVILPVVSSENRRYIPIAYNSAEIIANTNAQMIPNAELYVFGITTSLIHNVWMKAVCGRMKTDYAYSASIVYNTFPFPRISAEKQAEIEEAATDVLLTREPYLTMGKTLADLYDPDTMPQDLLEAHHRLDDIVESCYPGYPFATDEARLECLFKMYEKMTKK